MELENGWMCCSMARVVGSPDCRNCIFNDCPYTPKEGFQFCTFPDPVAKKPLEISQNNPYT